MGMRIIEITEDKKNRMSNLVEKILDAGGELMHCVKELGESDEMNERRNYRDDMGMRDGGRYGYRNDEPYESRERMGYRRY